jgi:hypothetical protein
MYTDAIQIGPSALSSEVVNLNQIRGSYICIYKLAEMVRLLLVHAFKLLERNVNVAR